MKTFKGLSALASVAPTLLIFGFFNSIFVGGFLRTAYNFAKYFIPYIIVTFLIIGIAETLHHVPALSALNAFGFDHMVLQIILFLSGVILYVLLTLFSYKKACVRFDKLDL